MNKPAYKIHPACADLPELPKLDFDELKESMRINGFDPHKPIIVYKTFIIAGRHREKAALELGIDPIYRNWSALSDDPGEIEKEIYSYVQGDELLRRHLTVGQKAGITQRWLSRGMIQAIDPPEGDKVHLGTRKPGQREAAKAANISVRSLQRSEYVSLKAQPEVKELLDRGVVQLRGAEDLSRLAPDVQRFAAARIRDGMPVPDAIREAKADERERSKPPVTDATGTRPPKTYEAAFSVRSVFADISRDIAAIKGRVADLAHHRGGALLVVNTINTDLDNAARFVRGAAPHAICPYCHGDQKGADGKKCTCCKGLGWVSKGVFDQAPADLKGQGNAA